MRKLLLLVPVFLACAPRARPGDGNAVSNSNDNPGISLVAGYEGGLVPVQIRYRAPLFIILEDGTVARLVQQDTVYEYKQVTSAHRGKILGLAQELWGSGMEGGYSVSVATDMANFSLRMRRDDQERLISVYGYGGQLEEGKALDALFAAFQKAPATDQAWEPGIVELRVESWPGKESGFRVYDWEGPDLPLDSLAENYQAMRLEGDDARGVIDFLRGKTVYWHTDMALFRFKGKTYAVALMPLAW